MKNSATNKLNKSIILILKPIVLPISIITIVTACIITLTSTNVNISIRDLWDSTFSAMESQIEIEFNKINTSKEQYKLMIDKCDEYIRVNGNNEEKIIVNTKINEQLYTDGNPSINMEKTKDEISAITNYFDNMVVVRYVSNKGMLSSIISEIDNKNNAVIVDKNKISNQINKGKNKGLSMTENEYLINLKDSLIEMLKSSGKIGSNKYFTDSGIKEIESLKSLNDIYNVSIDYINFGRSDISKQSKDTVLLKMTLDSIQHKKIMTIMLKLNNSNRVFNIDVI